MLLDSALPWCVHDLTSYGTGVLKMVDSDKQVEDQEVETPFEESRLYWQRQKTALDKALGERKRWSEKRRKGRAEGSAAKSWKRVTYSLPRSEAQAKAREFLIKYPKAAYWSEVESWRELPGDVIEFTMRRLPTAD
jgi:hypothetical protein